jgi:TIR domain
MLGAAAEPSMRHIGGPRAGGERQVTDVFISYKREDETRVARIARALEKAGFQVWWDRGLPGGESWHANIASELAAARCVIVIWSHGSVAPEGHYVRDEARRGLARAVLAPVLIDKIKDVPLGFGETQAIDLSRWKGNAGDPFFQDLVAAVHAKVEGDAVPKPRDPAARAARRLFYGGASSACLAAIGAVAFNTFGTATMLCTAPGPHPGLSDVCGAVGLGDRPVRAERLAWAALRPGSCQALRAHIARFPEGAYRREAADLLTARRVSYEDDWAPVVRPLTLFTPADGPAAPSDAEAKSRALTRAAPEAGRLCRGFGAGTLYRFVSATARAGTWSC